jgi:hypothetical protein
MAINKQAETVTLRNVTTQDTIDLTNWDMCSVTGNQHHPIGGTLAPGETKTFMNMGGPIWNNSASDPGALYNHEGRLVSYFLTGCALAPGRGEHARSAAAHPSPLIANHMPVSPSAAVRSLRKPLTSFSCLVGAAGSPTTRPQPFRSPVAIR